MQLSHVIVVLIISGSSAFAPPSTTLRDRPSRRGRVSVRAESEGELAVYGALGSVASCVVLYSEFTLKTTGCGLPAGPYGAVGAVEGVSYLAMIGIIGASLTKKVKTGTGLPAGPGGLLGLAQRPRSGRCFSRPNATVGLGEGLAYLAAVVGLGVLGFQLADYGYIPNAVPGEGAICK